MGNLDLVKWFNRSNETVSGNKEIPHVRQRILGKCNCFNGYVFMLYVT